MTIIEFYMTKAREFAKRIAELVLFKGKLNT